MKEIAALLQPQVIALLVAVVVATLILAAGLTVVRAMWNGTIEISHLLSESTALPGTAPKASLSRFQFLLFTFVVAGLYLVLSLETGTLIDVPNGTLVLLGISGGTYVAGKAMNGQGPSKDKGPLGSPGPAPGGGDAAAVATQASSTAREASQSAATSAVSAAHSAGEAQGVAETVRPTPPAGA
ncbi:hypothetical protein [Rhizobium halophytocola]|uniref:Uncharacterized protein n=1 Tax=Rhizobium halophytocola TaxID=735519 RepID=A0ABS4E3N1_9HYPH|nr:hypothetical protein [Rhizobium halophytocola]MBP1852555.1 hypothetical protein [Rhizobium halophytocola]